MQSKMLTLALLVLGLSLSPATSDAVLPHQGRGLAIVGTPVGSPSGLTAKTIVPATSFSTFRDNVDLVGDFNGDGQDDFVVQDATSLRILTNAASGGIRTLSRVRAGTWMGGWNYGGWHALGRVGDFDGNGRDDFVIYSHWGMGVIELQADGRLVDLAMAPHGTRIGDWTLSSNDIIEQVGRFDPIYFRDQLLIRNRASGHFAILVADASAGAFTARSVVREGTLIRQRGDSPIHEPRSWRLRRDDRFAGVIRMNGASEVFLGEEVRFVARDGLVIQRADGEELGVLYATRGRVHPATVLRVGELGYDRSTAVIGTGQFSRAGWTRNQIILKTAEGLRVLSFLHSGGGFYAHPQLFMKFWPTAFARFGSAMGSWRLDARDQLGPVGEFSVSGRDEVVIRSVWGTGIIRVDGGSLRHVTMHRNGSLLGRWLLQAANFLPDVVSDGSLNGGNAGDLDGDGRDDFLLQCGNVWNDCPSDVFPLP